MLETLLLIVAGLSGTAGFFLGRYAELRRLAGRAWFGMDLASGRDRSVVTTARGPMAVRKEG